MIWWFFFACTTVWLWLSGFDLSLIEYVGIICLYIGLLYALLYPCHMQQWQENMETIAYVLGLPCL